MAASGEVRTLLLEIVRTGGPVRTVVSEGPQAGTQQTKAVKRINPAVSQMDSITKSAAAGSEENAATTEELSSLAMSVSAILD